jgi:hypothetical protein
MTNTAQKTFNGWPSYEAWNTALWLNNDESQHSLVCEFAEQVVYHQITNDQAADYLICALPDRTGDGAEWDRDTVKHLIHEKFVELLEWS